MTEFLLLTHFAQSRYLQKQLSKPTQCEKLSLCSEKKIPPISDNQGEIGNCRLQSNSLPLGKVQAYQAPQDCSALCKQLVPCIFQSYENEKKKSLIHLLLVV